MGDSARVRTGDEVGEVSGLATCHVMLVRVGRELRPELKEGNQGKDLPLGSVTDGVPESRGVGLAGEGRSIHLHGPREFDAVGMDNVSNKGKHGTAFMYTMDRCRRLPY